METRGTGRLPIFIILFTVFIDMVGIGIVIPILAPVLLDAHGGPLPTGYTEQSRLIVLGFLIASYPLAQFFGAPILGGLSDRIGRRRALYLSMFGTVAAYVVFGAGILMNNLPMMFASRIVDGFTAGNISIVMSSMADLSERRDKAKNFGLVGMVFGLGFIVGPFVGGELANPGLVGWFNYSTPFFFAAALAAVNLAFVLLKFPETLAGRIKSSMSPLTGLRNIAVAFRLPNFRTAFTVIFIVMFGFSFFTQFFQVFLIDRFQFTQLDIGYFFAWVGVWVAISQGLVVRALANRFSPRQLLMFSILAFAATLPFTLLPRDPIYLYAMVPMIATFWGIIQSNYSALVSNMADAKSQGEILGISQSVQSLAMSMPPIISGFIAAFNAALPTVVASACTFLAWIVFMLYFRRHEDGHTFREVE